MTQVEHIQGISGIADRYDAFILDIFGVLHDGIRPFAGTVECLKELRAAGKVVCLLSNTPNRAARAQVHMAGMGIAPDLYDHIVTSGEATFEALQNRGRDLGDDCWFIGTDYGQSVLDGQNLTVLNGPEGASFILNSIPGTEEREVELLRRQLRIAADRGLPMICANPDLVVNIGDTQHECAGTFAAQYAAMGGRVTYYGKPHAPVYARCYELLGRPDKARICAVGDSFHTDIAGANAFGIDSVFNVDGIHQEELRDLGIEDLIEKQTQKPTYILNGFAW
ncbi:MAG: TIGR01459 family HAD-type hydrolase [Bdellovibrionales bacterium]